MKKFITLLAVAVFFSFCNQQQSQPSAAGASDSTTTDTTAILNDPKNNLNVQTSSFREIDSSGIIVFPLSMGEGNRERKNIYKEIPDHNYWNMVFYNSGTLEHYLLSERKMLITSYNLNEYTVSEGHEILKSSKYIFYDIITDDLNQDRKLTSADPAYLFITDRQGKNFRQVSPSGYDLVSWEFIKSSNKFIMTVRKDTDRNKKYDDEDEITAFQIDLDKDSQATEIFSAEFKKKLKVLYDRDWKRIVD